jgi:hypothetical protein
MNTRPDRRQVLFASLLAGFAGGWCPLSQLTLVNSGDLVLPPSAHAAWVMAVGLAVFAAALAVQVLAGAKRRETATAAVLAAGALAYLETTLLAGRIGPLTGAEPDWAALRPLMVVEIAALLAAAWAVARPGPRRWLVRRAVPVALVLVVASAANVAPALRAHNQREARPSAFTFTGAGLLDLSAEGNVVIVVLDSFQSDVFAGLAAADPGRRAALDGFTYFPDATSSFPRTNGSMPALLTGRVYDNSAPYLRWLDGAYREGSVLRALKRRGHDVRIHSFTPVPYVAHPDVADNLASTDDGKAIAGARRREQALLLDLLMFRTAPTPLRPWVYNHGRFRLSARGAAAAVPGDPYPLDDATRVLSAGNGFADLEFADRVRAYLNATSPAPAVRVYHLGSPHAPFHLGEDMSYAAERPYTPESYRAQAAGALGILEVLLVRMQELGVYDNSLVMVLADHGDGDMPALGIDTAALAALGWPGDIPTVDPVRDHTLVQGGIPLVLVKAPGARGALQVSTTPVALTDVPATIADVLDLPAAVAAGGRSMLAPPPAEPRRRLHRHYAFSGHGHSDYMLPMTEYAIDGFAWNPRSWSPTGRDLGRTALDGASGAGMVILGEGGNLDAAGARGWSAPAEHGRYIADTAAYLTLTAPPGAGSVALRAAMSHRPPQPPSQMVVSMNGEDVGAWAVGGLAGVDYVLFVPDRFLAGPLEIGFHRDAGTAPGPQIVEAHLDMGRRRPVLPQGRTVTVAAGQDGAPLLAGGWSSLEAWGTWSEGSLAGLSFMVRPVPEGAVSLEFHVTPAVWGAAPPVRVTVEVNGAAVGGAELERGTERLAVTVPAGVIGHTGHVDVVLRIANPRAPRDFVGGNDGRLLGVGLKGVLVGAR